MHNLEFRGRWIDIFGNVLLITLLTTITLGIYAPWGYARYKRVITTRTFYDDRPLQFDGTGGQAFVEFLIVGALTIVTLGLYPILGFATTRLLRWEYAHTILPTGQRLEYQGDAIDLFFEQFLLVFFSILTLGIYAFWGTVRMRRYIVSHTYLDGNPLQFEGTGGQYFIIWLLNTLFTTITLGIYAALGFSTVRLLRWDARSTVVPMPERSPRPMPVHSPTVSALRETASRGGAAAPTTTPPPPPVARPTLEESRPSPVFEEPGERYSRPNYAYPDPRYVEPEEDGNSDYVDPSQRSGFDDRGYGSRYGNTSYDDRPSDR
jgi:uncharacterized membrane protein YjgN (DUF898 family)